MSNQQGMQSKQQSGQPGLNGITRPQLFVITFVGWLILQVLSPQEWQSVIGTFLTVESTTLFLLSAVQQGRIPTESTVQFMLAAYLGYFIIYHSGSGSNQPTGSGSAQAKERKPSSKPSRRKWGV